MEANYDLMRDVESRYRISSGLNSRDHYSLFYGPLNRSKLLLINANPGGTPDNYKVVDVMAGEHEYVEGRESGPTTRNGAQMLSHIAGCNDVRCIRRIQVLNRFFRRSRQRPSAREEQAHMAEAKPYVAELIRYIQPEAMLFGGDSGVALFAQAHDGSIKAGPAVMGPNGSSDAVYFREYELKLPYYRTIPAYGIYHPSKMNRVFRERVFPELRQRLGPLVQHEAH